MPEYHWQLSGTPLSMEKGQVRWLGERETELPLVSSSRVLRNRVQRYSRVGCLHSGRAVVSDCAFWAKVESLPLVSSQRGCCEFESWAQTVR